MLPAQTNGAPIHGPDPGPCWVPTGTVTPGWPSTTTSTAVGPSSSPLTPTLTMPTVTPVGGSTLPGTWAPVWFVFLVLPLIRGASQLLGVQTGTSTLPRECSSQEGFRRAHWPFHQDLRPRVHGGADPQPVLPPRDVFPWAWLPVAKSSAYSCMMGSVGKAPLRELPKNLGPRGESRLLAGHPGRPSSVPPTPTGASALGLQGPVASPSGWSSVPW